MTKDWRANGDGATVTYSTDGVTLVATADGAGAAFDLLAPGNMEGAVIDFVVNVSNEFKTSTASLQPFAQIKAGTWQGEWNCWANNTDLTPGTDQTVTCTIAEDDKKFNQTAGDVQVVLQAKTTAPAVPAGTVVIKSVKVTLPK
ncbi:MAG TPA: family 15 carbohydrate-binding domain-containing protein [Cellvibrio sp.]|nr:family 15 carbohydrate-binding domain-containing protein [Cellvibrio sp.]